MFDRELFGKRLKYFRKKRGFTQEEFSEKADISYSYLLSLEAGKNNPSADVLISLLNAININYNELMNEKDYDKSLTDTVIEKFDYLDDTELEFISLILSKL